MSSKNKKKLILEGKKKVKITSSTDNIQATPAKVLSPSTDITNINLITNTENLNYPEKISEFLKKEAKKKTPVFEHSNVLIMNEEVKTPVVEKSENQKLIEKQLEIGDMLGAIDISDLSSDITRLRWEYEAAKVKSDMIDFLDANGSFITSYPDTSDSDESDGGSSGYEADIEDEPETTQAVRAEEEDVEPPILFYDYKLIIKKKKRFLYNNLIGTSTNFLILNYINYLFYKKDWIFLYPDSIRFKLAVRKYKFRLNKYKNSLYYAKRVKFDVSGARAVVQLTSRYRNKFFTFLRKSLHFNLSVGRVFFWKLKKTVYGRVVNFYNVFFRCIIPFMSRRFTVILYKLFRDWSNDFQKFNGAVLRARRSRKIRRTYSIFKVIIFPKLIYGFMRSPKYPIRKRFLQRRAFIKYMCS